MNLKFVRQTNSCFAIFIVAYTLGSLIDVYNYFFDQKSREGFLILALFLIVSTAYFFIRTRLRISAVYQYITFLLLLFITAFGVEVVFEITGFFDWAGLICLLFAVYMALTQTFLKNLSSYILIFIIGLGIGLLFTSKTLSLVFAFIGLVICTYDTAQKTKFVRLIIPLTFTLLIAACALIWLPSIDKFKSQNGYFDKVVFSHHTRLHQIDITQWKGQNYFYYDGIKYISSVDEWMYYEPLIHPLLHLLEDSVKNVLVIGGENGCALRELAKYKSLSIDQWVFDTEILALAKNHPLFLKMNANIYTKLKVNQIDSDVFRLLASKQAKYDAIIIDLPDPLDVELNQFYTKEFYELCKNALRPQGMMVTQAGSPYFAQKAFYSVEHTMRSSGLKTLPMHNQIPSLGEWGWVIGYADHSALEVSESIEEMTFDKIETTWLNKEALSILFSFGTSTVRTDEISINTLKNPVTYSLYKLGDLTID